MHYELLASILILICLFVLGVEYLCLYILASKHERHNEGIRAATDKLGRLVEGIMYSPTKSVREKEIELVKDTVKEDVEMIEVLCGRVEAVLAEANGKIPDYDQKVSEIYEAVNLINTFANLLKNGTKYEQGYACRRLADFECRDYIEQMRDIAVIKIDVNKKKDNNKQNNKKTKVKKAKHADRERAYSAAMALSHLGDVEGVVTYIKSIQSDKNYSGRIINEIFDEYGGDKAELAQKVFEICNDYIRCTVIKAITKYKIEQFESIYKEGVTSTDRNVRIACVKALGKLGKPEYQHTIIVASKDSDWVVRISAISGLQELRSTEAINAVKDALKDKEWWVRQTAAKALINMNATSKDLEDVIFGYDRYAADALKYALYKTVDMR